MEDVIGLNDPLGIHGHVIGLTSQRGGEISSGEISGGEISGGEISGGEISGGEISGGEVWAGRTGNSFN
jgi:hypothetical protein